MTPEIIERVRTHSGPLYNPGRPEITTGFADMIPPVNQYLRFVPLDHQQDPTRLVRFSDIVRRGDAADEQAFVRFCDDIDAKMFCSSNPLNGGILYPHAIGLLYREEMAWRQEFVQLPTPLTVAEISDILSAPEQWIQQQLPHMPITKEDRRRKKVKFYRSIVKHLRYEKLTSPDMPIDRISLLDVAGYFDQDETSLESIARDGGIDIGYHVKDGVLVATIDGAELDRLDELVYLGGIDDTAKHILYPMPPVAQSRQRPTRLTAAAELDSDDTPEEALSLFELDDGQWDNDNDDEGSIELIDFSDTAALSALVAEIRRLDGYVAAS